MNGYETSGRLDLTLGASQAPDAALTAVRNRLSDLLAVDPARIVLTGDAARVLSEWRAAGGDPLDDLTARALSQLPEISIKGPALVPAGPPEARLCALVLENIALGEALRRDSESRLSPLLLDAALKALAPAGLAQDAARRAARDAAMAGVLETLKGESSVSAVRLEGGRLEIEASDRSALTVRLRRAGLALDETEDGFFGTIPDATTARQVALALGAEKSGGRSASRRRTTKETDILVAVDLDAAGARIETGLAFYDHMLEQVAAHGGFALTVSAQGDLGVDAHHTIEDVALALGEAVAEALGDKRGIGRYGFTAPMDEAQASVAIDLSGRPLSRFEGEFKRSEIGGFPTEMTPHVFRSLADSLKAAIHVRVEGDDDHHKVEACFKGFGRALRQAIRQEGGDTPSTKGVL